MDIPFILSIIAAIFAVSSLSFVLWMQYKDKTRMKRYVSKLKTVEETIAYMEEDGWLRMPNNVALGVWQGNHMRQRYKDNIEIWQWILEETKGEFGVGHREADDACVLYFILFEEEADAVAFKLRWL